jgi:hypothetical protein
VAFAARSGVIHSRGGRVSAGQRLARVNQRKRKALPDTRRRDAKSASRRFFWLSQPFRTGLRSAAPNGASISWYRGRMVRAWRSPRDAEPLILAEESVGAVPIRMQSRKPGEILPDTLRRDAKGASGQNDGLSG